MVSSWRNRTLADKNRRREEQWMASSLRPENFIPGLVVGFILGLFTLLPTRYRGAAKKKTFSFQPKRGSSFSAADDELKMVLVVRQDLKMGVGKIASQCAHAASGLYAELMKSQQHLLRQWENCGQPKIVVSCKNMQEMNKLKNAAESIGIPTFIVADAGRTQVLAGSKTVLAIGPGRKDLVDSVTGKLRLL